MFPCRIGCLQTGGCQSTDPFALAKWVSHLSTLSPSNAATVASQTSCAGGTFLEDNSRCHHQPETRTWSRRSLVQSQDPASGTFTLLTSVCFVSQGCFLMSKVLNSVLIPDTTGSRLEVPLSPVANRTRLKWLSASPFTPVLHSAGRT